MYQNPFDGEQQIEFYGENEDYVKKIEKNLDEDNVEEIFGINKRGNRDIRRSDNDFVKRDDEEMDIEPDVGG
jgi:hypothetical protein